MAIVFKQTSACIVYDPQTKRFLAVSRGRGSDLYGFPGGKVEAGETTEQGAVRELKEETGLIAGKMSFLYQSAKKTGNECTTFVVHDWSGEIVSSDEGDVVWVKPEVLIKQSPWGSYNSDVIDKFMDKYVYSK